MKKDKTDVYCSRLKKSLGCGDDVISDVRGYIKKESEFYMAEGCSQKLALQITLDKLGTPYRLAKQLKKAEPSENGSLFDGYISALRAKYEADGKKMRKFSTIRWNELIMPPLFVFFNMAMWVFIHVLDLIFGFNIAALIVCTVLCFVSTLLFLLWEHSIDASRPFFSLKNMIIAAALSAASVIFYKLFDLCFFEAGLYIIDAYFVQFYENAFVIFFMRALAFVLVMITAVFKRYEDGKIFTVLAFVMSIVSLPAFCMTMPFTPIWFAAVLLFIIISSIYTTLYCKNKYWVRNLLQAFVAFDLFEMILFITIQLSPK